MKILYIIPSTSSSAGSNTTFISVLKHMHAMGSDILCVFPYTGPIYYDLKALGIQVTAYSSIYAIYPTYDSWKNALLWLPRLCKRIIVNEYAKWKTIALCKRFQPDLIHSNASITDIGYRAAQHLHIPHVWHIREYGDKDFSWHYYPCKKHQQHLYRQQGSYTVCITKDIQKHHGLEGYINSRVIYDSIPYISQASKTPSFSKEMFFLYAGRIEPAKGALELLQAYAVYVEKTSHPWPLFFAGKISNIGYKRLLDDLVTTRHLENMVRFIGERSDIRDWYCRAQCLVIPSRSEGFGLVMPEGMLHGALVIAHNTGGTKEQLDNGLELTGEEIALRYDTEEELVQHLCEVTEKPIEYFAPMIQRAYETVHQLYSEERNANNVYQFYQDILQHKV